MYLLLTIYIYIYILEKIEKILKYRLDFCKIMLKAIVGSLKRMGCLCFPLPLRCARHLPQGTGKTNSFSINFISTFLVPPRGTR